MKKTRFLALIMVVAVMLMGAGYAQWTDLLTVDAEICTGDMNVEFTGEGGAWIWCDHTGIEAECAEVSYESNDGKTESISFTNIYPGVVIQYLTFIENTGTIPVDIEQVTINPIDCPLNEYLVGWVNVKVRNACGVLIDNKREEGIHLGEVPEALVDITEGIELLKDETMEISLVLEFPCAIVNGDNLEGKCCEFDMEFGFGQATCGVQPCETECPDIYSVNTYPLIENGD